MEPGIARPPRHLRWLLLCIGVTTFIAVTGIVGTKLVRGLLSRRTCCAPVPEPKANLMAIYTSQRAWYGEKDTYTEDLGQMGFLPFLGNRYTFFAAPRGRVLTAGERQGPEPTAGTPRPPYQIVAADPEAPKFRGTFETFAQTGCPLTLATLPDGTRAGLGVTLSPGGANPPGVFIAAAVANIDDDPTPDCWSIATVERVAADGEHIGPGQPYNELNDVER